MDHTLRKAWGSPGPTIFIQGNGYVTVKFMYETIDCFEISSDLDSTLSLFNDEELSQICVVEESPDYPGQLVFQTLDAQMFYEDYQDWVSRFCVLNEIYNLKSFVSQLDSDGYVVLFLDSCRAILSSYTQWAQPCQVDGFDMELHGFQQFSLRRALESKYFFANWCAGAGKSLLAAAGAQELFNHGEIDLVVAFTMQKLKRNLSAFFTDHTQLSAVVVDGPPERRERQYNGICPPVTKIDAASKAAADLEDTALGGNPMTDTNVVSAPEGTQVVVLNYDKAWADLDTLKSLVAHRRVLFVLDEVQKILTDGRKNRSRKAFDEIVKSCKSPVIWTMSASVVSATPLKYRDVFSTNGGRNPLGSKTDFEDRYCHNSSKRRVRIDTRNGGHFTATFIDWNLSALHEVRHRVADRTQSARKTDPGVRENFKGLQTIVVPVLMSPEDRTLYDIIVERARQAKDSGETLAPYYRLLRYVCNCPEALTKTADEYGQSLAQQYPKLVVSEHSSKLELLCDQVEAFRDAGDKVVCFIRETNLGLFFLGDALTRRKIKHVLHYGVGQSDALSQQAQEDFKADSEITVFLSSDAGAYGLNFQCSRYVINFDVPYAWDILMQRSNRIDRADSYLDGLTSYVYVTENSVEERIWAINNQRRELAAATLGTQEALSYQNEMAPDTLAHLIFG